jgi:hypothetical protein
VALEGGSGDYASVGSEPADWASLGFPFTQATAAPVSASGSISYSTPAVVDVASGSIASYIGAGNVTLSAIEDPAGDSVGASEPSNYFVGGSITTTVSACALYTVTAAALPEAPSIVLLPIGGRSSSVVSPPDQHQAAKGSCLRLRQLWPGVWWRLLQARFAAVVGPSRVGSRPVDTALP